MTWYRFFLVVVLVAGVLWYVGELQQTEDDCGGVLVRNHRGEFVCVQEAPHE